MTAWTPREHDHVVEPVFVALTDELRTGVAQDRRGTIVLVVLAAIAIAVRVGLLLRG